MSIENLKRVIEHNLTVAAESERCIGALLKQRTVEVISNFNDQQFGRSRPSLKGKRFTINGAFVEDGGVTVFLDGLRCGARLGADVALVDTASDT